MSGHLLDELAYEVLHDRDDGWRWRTGRWVTDSGNHIDRPYDAEGATLTRWGAVRAAKRSIRQRERHERKAKRNITLNTQSGGRADG